MSIRKIKEKWLVDFRFKGKRYRKKSPINTKGGAQKYEACLLNKLIQGEDIDKNDIRPQQLFKDFAWYWYKTYAIPNNKLSARQSKRLILQKHLVPYFGKMPLDKITAMDIEKFKSKSLKGRSKKTVNNYLGVLNKCLADASEWLDLSQIPKVKMFKVIYNKRGFLTGKEAEKLLSNADGIWHTMILTALRTGMRLGELIGLRWEDIDFDKMIINVNNSIVRGVAGLPKNNKTRTIPMSHDLFQALQSADKSSKYVFETRKGYPLSTNNCFLNIQKIRKKAGLEKLGWHMLRHTFATLLASNNVPLISIKELMGHSDIQTTMRYSHLVPGALTEAINIYEQKNNFGHYMGIASKEEEKIMLPNYFFSNNFVANVKENSPRRDCSQN